VKDSDRTSSVAVSERVPVIFQNDHVVLDEAESVDHVPVFGLHSLSAIGFATCMISAFVEALCNNNCLQ